MLLLEITWPTVEVSESSKAAEALTSTVSVSAPGFNAKSRRTTWSTSSFTSGRDWVLKPGMAAANLYRPTGSRVNV